jgi:YHS domain-containing protein
LKIASGSNRRPGAQALSLRFRSRWCGFPIRNSQSEIQNALDFPAMNVSDSAPTQKQVLDPVCGMVITPDKAAAKIEHGGHEHYFCSKQCQAEFEKDPKKYH